MLFFMHKAVTVSLKGEYPKAVSHKMIKSMTPNYSKRHNCSLQIEKTQMNDQRKKKKDRRKYEVLIYNLLRNNNECWHNP